MKVDLDRLTLNVTQSLWQISVVTNGDKWRPDPKLSKPSRDDTRMQMSSTSMSTCPVVSVAYWVECVQLSALPS